MQQCRLTFVPAMFALVFVTASTRAAPAADCAGKPTAQSPPGQHWYYRTDRATHRQCWYLAAQGSDVQRGATASARTRPAATHRAHRPTAAAPETTRAGAAETTRVASVGQANVPAPAAPEPAEAAKLPDAPPASEPAPQPELAEASQSADAIDPASAPTTSPAKEPQPPVKAQSSRVAAAVQAAANADQPSPWIVIPLGLLAMVAPMYYAARWLRRRMASARQDLGELLPATAYVSSLTSPDSDSETAVRHISQPKALEQAEKEVAQALQQLLSGTETKQYAESLDQTEKLAQELQQLLNEAQTKQCAKPLDQTEQLVQALNVVRSRVSDPAEPHHAQPAPAADEALRSRDLLLANQGN